MKIERIPDMASIDLLPRNQRFSRFFSPARQFFCQLSEQTLKNYAPGFV